MNEDFLALVLALVEIKHAVHAAIRALAFACRARARLNQGQRPLLELPLVQFRQRLGAAKIGGLAAFLKLNIIAESVFEAAFDEVDGKVGDINANPLPSEFLRRVNGGAATAKWIKHDVALVAADRNDAFQQGMTGFCVG